MKTIIVSIISVLLSGCMLLSAQTINRLDKGRYSIEVGEVSMIIDAAHGGKIVSYALEKDYEIISQLSFPNSFGSTFWPSPQGEWDWPPVPEYDTLPFEAEIKDGALILTGRKSERFGYRICKKFVADPTDCSIEITYSIINETDEIRKVAPWEVTRTPNGGMIFFEADEVSPYKDMEPLPFTFQHGAAWYEIDTERFYRKINADGKGWIGFIYNAMLVVKKFQDIDQNMAAPGEAEIQLYVHGGRTFIEIESQGAYTSLKPGEKLDWTVKWYLIDMPRPAKPSKALVNKVKKMIK